jgi:cobyrinic acid a,c-diamide synthase
VAEGCARLAEGFRIVGAIVNEVASARHAALVREGFLRTGVPLLGLVRGDPGVALPSRHLGLVQAEEHEDLARRIRLAGALVAEGCDLDRIVEAAAPPGSRGGEGEAHGVETPSFRPSQPAPAWEEGEGRPFGLPPLGSRIAVARDVAFAFVYPHILEGWRDAGAELSFFSPLADEPPAESADAVFLPGGYPELHAGRLAAAERFRAGMAAAAGRGALIYGECGGYMVLGDSLVDAAGVGHRMLGLLPLATSFAQRRLQLGYRLLTPLAGLPWREPLAAHEFHYATVVSEAAAARLFTATDAAGVPLGEIGLRRGQVMGSFAHVIDAAPICESRY